MAGHGLNSEAGRYYFEVQVRIRMFFGLEEVLGSCLLGSREQEEALKAWHSMT